MNLKFLFYKLGVNFYFQKCVEHKIREDVFHYQF